MKKVQTVDSDFLDGFKKNLREEPTIYLASHTQQRRVELKIASDENAYRVIHKPTVHERIVTQRNHTKQLLRQARMASQNEALIKQDMLRKDAEGLSEMKNTVEEDEESMRILHEALVDFEEEEAKAGTYTLYILIYPLNPYMPSIPPHTPSPPSPPYSLT